MKTCTARDASLLGVSALLAAAATAGAGTITGKFTSQFSQGANITASGGIYNGNVNTVLYKWTRTDTPGVGGADATIPITFDTYCVDLSQSVKAGTVYTFDLITMTQAGYSAQQQLLLTQLWNSFKPGVDTKAESASFQLAVWEIVYDTNLNTSNGTFKVNSSSSLRSSSQNLVTAASNLASNPLTPSVQLFVLRSNKAQDQIVGIPMVPSPGAVALAGLGLLMAAPRRKTRA